jgi:hypothetical protein
MDTYPPAKQRAALVKLVPALGCREAALRRDECGDWRINGSQGHVYAVPGGSRSSFMMYVMTETARAWTFAKRALMPFATIVNDGDEEGSFVMDRLPTKTEAKAIRKCLGLAKKREVSLDEVVRLRSLSAANRSAQGTIRAFRTRVSESSSLISEGLSSAAST